METLAEDIEWDISAHPLPDWPNRGKGREELLRHFAVYLTGWQGYESEVRELIDAGDDVVVVLHETARIGGSDVILDRDLVQVWTARDGRAVRLRVFPTAADARRAAGMSE